MIRYDTHQLKTPKLKTLMPKILQPEASYTFRSFFEFPNDPDEILAELGYRYLQARLLLPRTSQSLPGLEGLKVQIEETLPYVQLTSETAKREVLVAPVLLWVARNCQHQSYFDVMNDSEAQVFLKKLSINSDHWTHCLLNGNLHYKLRSFPRS